MGINGFKISDDKTRSKITNVRNRLRNVLVVTHHDNQTVI